MSHFIRRFIRCGIVLSVVHIVYCLIVFALEFYAQNQIDKKLAELELFRGSQLHWELFQKINESSRFPISSEELACSPLKNCNLPHVLKKYTCNYATVGLDESDRVIYVERSKRMSYAMDFSPLFVHIESGRDGGVFGVLQSMINRAALGIVLLFCLISARCILRQ